MNADTSMRVTLSSMEFECLANVVREYVEQWEDVRAQCYDQVHDENVRFLILHHELVHNLYRTLTPRMKQLDETWEPLEELLGSMPVHGPIAVS